MVCNGQEKCGINGLVLAIRKGKKVCMGLKETRQEGRAIEGKNRKRRQGRLRKSGKNVKDVVQEVIYSESLQTMRR